MISPPYVLCVNRAFNKCSANTAPLSSLLWFFIGHFHKKNFIYHPNHCHVLLSSNIRILQQRLTELSFLPSSPDNKNSNVLSFCGIIQAALSHAASGYFSCDTAQIMCCCFCFLNGGFKWTEKNQQQSSTIETNSIQVENVGKYQYSKKKSEGVIQLILQSF